MKVRWQSRAELDLIGIVEYIAVENPAAALRMARRVKHAAEELAEFPLAFREGGIEGTRERFVQRTSYIIVYAVFGDWIDILSVFHAAQDRPRGD